MNDERRPTFPAIDQPMQRPSRGTVRELITPGDDVPSRRVQQRASVGTGDEPMIEIDRAGTIVYVGGDWAALVGFTKPGPGALDVLLGGSVSGDVVDIRQSIETARSQGTSSVWDHGSLPELPFLKVVAIPSATVGGDMHALVGLSSSAAMNQTPERPSLARHRVEDQR